VRLVGRAEAAGLAALEVEVGSGGLAGEDPVEAAEDAGLVARAVDNFAADRVDPVETAGFSVGEAGSRGRRSTACALVFTINMRIPR
jgi:hypothetical protein